MSSDLLLILAIVLSVLAGLLLGVILTVVSLYLWRTSKLKRSGNTRPRIEAYRSPPSRRPARLKQQVSQVGSVRVSPQPRPEELEPVPPVASTVIEPEEIDTSGDFGEAHSLLARAQHCIFITGKAGTGKSTLLKLYIENTQRKVALLAPTGIAAVSVGGETIHSFFKFPPRPINPEDIKRVRDNKIFKALDAIVIDEVSMVRADLMDAIDEFMRKNGKDSNLPFGGVQVILFGDVYQLPPVVASEEEAEFFSSYYPSPFFFDARVFAGLPIQVVELTRVFRQSDAEFIALLDAFRKGRVRGNELRQLNQRHVANHRLSLSDDFITLTTTNRLAAEINEEMLAQLAMPEVIFEGRITGKFPNKALPTDFHLRIRQNSQVMFVKNDPGRRWVNGTIGRVVEVGDEGIRVEIVSEEGTKVCDVGPHAWEILKHRIDRNSGRIVTEVVGQFVQLPVKLAWAVTIHKSQGLTLDKVVIDMGWGAFAHGQTYVALSRCRTLEGIVLSRPISLGDVKVDPRVSSFFEGQDIQEAEPIKVALLETIARDAPPPSPTVAESGSEPKAAKPFVSSPQQKLRKKKCPHGVPRPYLCAICEPEKFKLMTGIG